MAKDRGQKYCFAHLTSENYLGRQMLCASYFGTPFQGIAHRGLLEEGNS